MNEISTPFDAPVVPVVNMIICVSFSDGNSRPLMSSASELLFERISSIEKYLRLSGKSFMAIFSEITVFAFNFEATCTVELDGIFCSRAHGTAPASCNP